MNIPSGWNQNNNAQKKSAVIPYSLTLSPFEITASENIARFSFTPYVSDVSAVPFYQAIRVVANVAVGSVLEIENDLIHVILTASLTPSFNEFYTETATATPAYRSLVAESISYELSDNLSFSRFYDVVAQGDFIFITAKSVGTEFNFVTLNLPTNILISQTIAGLDQFSYQSFLDYTFFAEIYSGSEVFNTTVNKSASELLDTYIIPPLLSTDLNINVGDLVGGTVDAVLPLKGDLVSTLYWKLLDSAIPKHLRPYFVVYGDYFRYEVGGEKKKRVQGVSEVRWVQLAAQHQLNPYDFQRSVWNPKTTAPFYFLTDMPDNKLVTYSSVEFVQAILRTASANNDAYGLEITYNFYDGTNYVQTIMGGGYNNIGGNISFDVSPDVINLQGIENFIGKLVDSFEVRVRWQLGSNYYTSYPATYTMHRICNESSTNIIWLNDLGGWDSIECRGEVGSTTQKNVLSFDRLLPFDANTAEAVAVEISLNYNVNFNTTYSVSTGFIDVEHFLWLKGLLKSTAVFVWDVDLRDFRAISITSDDFSSNTAKKQAALNLSYRFTVTDNTITR